MDIILSYWCQRSIRQFTLQSKYYDNNYCRVSYKLLVTMITATSYQDTQEPWPPKITSSVTGLFTELKVLLSDIPGRDSSSSSWSRL